MQNRSAIQRFYSIAHGALCLGLLVFTSCQLNKPKGIADGQGATEVDVDAVTFENPETVTTAMVAGYFNAYRRCGISALPQNDFERAAAEIEDYFFYILVPLINQELVQVDEEQLKDCLRALLNETCSTHVDIYELNDYLSPYIWDHLPMLASECRSIFTGAADLGGECFADMHCGPELYCDMSMGCPGQCQARTQEREACINHRTCPLGQYCHDDVIHECRIPALEESDPCTRNMMGCGPGLWCRDLFDDNHCRPLSDLKAGGGQNRQCSFSCQDPTEKCVLSLTLGGAYQLDGNSNPVGFCESRTLEQGEECPVYAYPDLCGEGMYCHVTGDVQSQGRCLPAPGEDNNCEQLDGRDACAPGLICNPFSGQCDRLRRFGEICQSSSQCSTKSCRSSRCSFQSSHACRLPSL